VSSDPFPWKKKDSKRTSISPQGNLAAEKDAKTRESHKMWDSRVFQAIVLKCAIKSML
jgi:hypothetical protein